MDCRRDLLGHGYFHIGVAVPYASETGQTSVHIGNEISFVASLSIYIVIFPPPIRDAIMGLEYLSLMKRHR
jgi:hypothetical protein